MTHLESGEMLTDQEFLYRWAVQCVDMDMSISTEDAKYINEKLKSARDRLNDIVVGHMEYWGNA